MGERKHLPLHLKWVSEGWEKLRHPLTFQFLGVNQVFFDAPVLTSLSESHLQTIFPASCSSHTSHMEQNDMSKC